MPYAIQRAVDGGRRQIQASGHDHEAVDAARTLERQVAGHKKRAVGMAKDHDSLLLRPEVADRPMQYLDADVDLGREVLQRQLFVAGRQVMVQGKGLVYLDEMDVLAIRKVLEVA